MGAAFGPRDLIEASGICLGAALDNDGHDDGTGFRHPPTKAPAECFLCRATCGSYVLKQHTAPATKKALGIPICAEGFLAPHV